MLKRWKIGEPDSKIAEQLRRKGSISQLCAEILVSRGIENVERAAEILNVEELSDPFLLKDMDRAAERILEAVDSGEQICVYGDYDCDGVTATVMLTDWLLCAGAEVTWYIPTRKEGYGMREEQIRRLHDEGVSLIITVDNGISAIEEAKLIRELGMDLIVTDHHRAGDTLPEAVAVVDPFRPDCTSPYKTICGAVVVLKLISALDGGEWKPAMEQFGELAALATIADVMPLEGENRYIVQTGLQLLANTDRFGLIALMGVCGMKPGEPITAQTAAFQLIPRINAAGRFASASIAAQLLLTDNSIDAKAFAEEIHALNQERRVTEQEIVNQILDEIRRAPELLHARVLVFAGEDWHHGVIGIVAARLMERFGKPCFLMAREADGFRGSARSFGDFSVFDCLKECAPHLLRYGGHTGAGGFTVAESEKDAFCAAIQAYAAVHNPVMPVLTAEAVRALEPKMLTPENVEGISVLEPFGMGNPKPLFVLNQMLVTEVLALSGGVHTKLRLRSGNVQHEALMFRIRPEETGISVGMQIDVLISADVKDYMGRKSLTLRVEDWRLSQAAQEQAIAAQAAYDTYCRGEPLPAPAYYQRMCPHRQDLVAVYQLVQRMPMTISQICTTLKDQGMNRCRARMIADIFRELNLLSYDAVTETLAKCEVTQKRELNESEAYRKIYAMTAQ